MKEVKKLAVAPKNSTLQVAVKSTGGPVNATVAVISSAGQEEWKDSQIHPGPKSKALSAGVVYTLIFRLTFLGKGSARIELVVNDQQGAKVFGNTMTVEGKKGDVVLRAATVKAQ
jgi:hypothetical protein